MKRRLMTGLALALALGGCTTYGYVDDGGGYYTGGAATDYNYVYPAYAGYGAYGYGWPAYGYAPGWSFGLGYGYGYGYGYRPGYGYSYGPPYGPRYRPHYYPDQHHHYPRPRPDHQDRPDHDGRPDHRPPPVAGDGNPPPLNRAPWRDLERMRRGDGEDGMPRRQPRPGTMGAVGPGPMPGALPGDLPVMQPGVQPGMRQGTQPGRGMRYGDGRPTQAYRTPGPRIDPAAGSGRGMSAPPPRSERSMSRSAPRSRDTGDSGPSRIGTPDTIEP